MYSLEECLEHSTRFPRWKRVYKILCKNDICNWNDLITKPLPSKGLIGYELLALDDLRCKATYILEYKAKARMNFAKNLDHYAVQSEASRIAGILVNNGIFSIYRLYATPDDKLAKLSGIGKKSLDILKRFKADIELKSVSAKGKTTHTKQLTLPNFEENK